MADNGVGIGEEVGGTFFRPAYDHYCPHPTNSGFNVIQPSPNTGKEQEGLQSRE